MPRIGVSCSALTGRWWPEDEPRISGRDCLIAIRRCPSRGQGDTSRLREAASFSQPWNGNDLDTYADDLAELVQKLALKDAIHIGHSTGGGEVARYIGRHGTKRVAKAVLIGAIPPLMLKTAANPGGLPLEIFDG